MVEKEYLRALAHTFLPYPPQHLYPPLSVMAVFWYILSEILRSSYSSAPEVILMAG